MTALRRKSQFSIHAQTFKKVASTSPHIQRGIPRMALPDHYTRTKPVPAVLSRARSSLHILIQEAASGCQFKPQEKALPLPLITNGLDHQHFPYQRGQRTLNFVGWVDSLPFVSIFCGSEPPPPPPVPREAREQSQGLSCHREALGSALPGWWFRPGFPNAFILRPSCQEAAQTSADLLVPVNPIKFFLGRGNFPALSLCGEAP